MSWVYLAFAVLQIVLAVVMVRLYKRDGTFLTLIPVYVCATLAIDNLIIGSGRFIGEGDLLKNLNFARFILHAFDSAFTTLFLLDVARRIGFKWTKLRLVFYSFLTIAILMFIYSFYFDILAVKLVPSRDRDVLRYKDEVAKFPLPSIYTILVMIVIGGMIWFKIRSPLVFVCGVIEFICAGFGSLIAKTGELFYAFGLISGEKLAQKEFE